MVTRKRKLTLSSHSGSSKWQKTKQSNTKSKPVVIKFSCHKPKNSSLGTKDCAVSLKKLPMKLLENKKVLHENNASEVIEVEENNKRIDENESNLQSHNVEKFDTSVKKKDGKVNTKKLDTKVSCDYCDQKFSSIMKLQSHHKEAHKVNVLEKSISNIDKPLDKKSYESAKPYLEAHWWFSVGICKYKLGYKSHDLLHFKYSHWLKLNHSDWRANPVNKFLHQ